MYISEKELEKLRAAFPANCRVQLTKMDDPQAPPVGTQGTVQHVDDIGTIHVAWDNGCGLGVAYGEDSCVRVAPNTEGGHHDVRS